MGRNEVHPVFYVHIQSFQQRSSSISYRITLTFQKSVNHVCVGLFTDSSVPMTCVSILMPIPHCLLYCIYIVSLYISLNGKEFQIVFKTGFATLGPLPFHMILEAAGQFLEKKTCLDFDIFAQIYTPIWGSLSPQPYWVSGIMNLYISPFIEMFSCISPMTCNFHCICVCILFNSPLFYAFETIVNVFFKLHFPFIVSLDK